jgi:peptidoglycan/LPS O-acetylase OafA/YrhL
MIPVARNTEYKFPKGLKTYFFRRFKRIVPPYWAALILSLILIYSVPVMQTQSGTKWDDKLPVTWDAIVGHFLLIQDFVGGSIKINGPLWTVALEWQIYFIFALIMLPLWRFIGKWATLAIVSLVTLGPSIVTVVYSSTGKLKSLFSLASMIESKHIHQWYVLLFALGMLAAELAGNSRLKGRGLWLPSVLAFGYIFYDPSFGERNKAAVEVLIGLSVALLLVWLAKNGRNFVNRFLSSKPMLELGNMSYSIYLMHSPLLALGNLVLLPSAFSAGIQATLMYLVVLPLALVISRAFHVLIERRFMNTHQKELVTAGLVGLAKKAKPE